jgi:hypothetical protein
MDFNVTRDDANQPLQNCGDAFNDIIDKCIANGNFWGGKWELNGFHYAISNGNYPGNSLEGPPFPTQPSSVSGMTVVKETNSQGSTITGTVGCLPSCRFQSLTYDSLFPSHLPNFQR